MKISHISPLTFHCSLVIGHWSLFTFYILLLASCSKKEGDTHQHGAKVYYTCSMDPQVMETKPGKCPICHMELTPVTLDQTQSNGIKLSEQQIELANIKTQKVVYSTINGDETALGTLAVDEEKVNTYSLRIDGRIDHLYFKTLGRFVNKGDVLFMLYSEMLNAVQEEYILNSQRTGQTGDSTATALLMKAAENKLLLWGVTHSQLNKLKQDKKPIIPFPFASPVSGYISDLSATEGAYAMQGQKIMELTDYSTLWIETQFYPENMSLLAVGTEVQVVVEAFPGMKIKGKIVSVYPQLLPQSKIDIARIQITNKDNLFKPGMQAYISLKHDEHRTIVLNSQAIIKEANGYSAWIKNAEGVFEPRMLHTGIESGNQIEVLHGLSEGEEVVVSGAYLLHSEYIFKKGMNPMAGHDMSKM